MLVSEAESSRILNLSRSLFTNLAEEDFSLDHLMSYKISSPGLGTASTVVFERSIENSADLFERYG